MKIEKHTESLAVYQPKLDSIPEWNALSSKDQGELYEITMRGHQYRQLKMLGEFGELLELYRVQQFLEGKPIKMIDYLSVIYPDAHRRTLDRKREVFNQIASTIPPSVLNRLAASGSETLNRFSRIAAATLGDIRNAVLEVPALPASTEKAAEKYLEQVETKLQEHRQNRRKGKPLQQNEEFAAKMATNSVLHYIRGCATLKTSAQKRHWLTRVMGWVMEAQAVSGTLRAGRIAIPDGILIRRGRPRKKREKEVA